MIEILVPLIQRRNPSSAFNARPVLNRAFLPKKCCTFGRLKECAYSNPSGGTPNPGPGRVPKVHCYAGSDENRHLKSFAEHDVDGIVADYSSDAVLFVPGGPLKGPD